MTFTFTDGRRVTLPAREIRLQIDGGVVVEVSPWDDVSLRTEWRAPGLTFHRGRIGFPADTDEEFAMFRTEALSWFATDLDGEFRWTVQIQVSLTSSPTGPR